MSRPSTSGPQGPDRIGGIEGLGGHCSVPEGLCSVPVGCFGPVDLVAAAAAAAAVAAAADELEAFCRNL